ncbi:hypothetical protein ABZP36_016221 [Zizania latifolia]
MPPCEPRSAQTTVAAAAAAAAATSSQRGIDKRCCVSVHPLPVFVVQAIFPARWPVTGAASLSYPCSASLPLLIALPEVSRRLFLLTMVLTVGFPSLGISRVRWRLLARCGLREKLVALGAHS